jgi:hypothetical protein
MMATLAGNKRSMNSSSCNEFPTCLLQQSSLTDILSDRPTTEKMVDSGNSDGTGGVMLEKQTEEWNLDRR